jgi:septation ring formation regulator EzrA
MREMADKTIEQIVAETMEKSTERTAQLLAEGAVAAAKVLAEANSDNGVQIAVLQTNVNNLQCQLEAVEKKTDSIFAKLEDIIKGRPTWAVAGSLAFMGTLCGILATALAMVLINK